LAAKIVEKDARTTSSARKPGKRAKRWKKSLEARKVVETTPAS
jgi:hypothetical protein